MSFEIDKTGEDRQKHINQHLSDESRILEQSGKDAEGLSENESTVLSSGLTGENKGANPIDVEGEELAEKLSGKDSELVDSTGFQSQNSTETEAEQFSLNTGKQIALSENTINYYKSLYPNIANGYLNNGILYLLDSNNYIIKDTQGEPVQVNYTKVKDSNSIDLVNFYSEHCGEEFDINKMQYFQELQTNIEKTDFNNPDYKNLILNSELEKLRLLTDEEQKNYILTKMWNASNNNDFSAWNDILKIYFSFKFQNIGNKFGQSDYIKFLEEHTSINNLAEHIKKVTSNMPDKISKAELMWNILDGISKLTEIYIKSTTPEFKNVNPAADLHISSQLKEAAKLFFDNINFLLTQNTTESTDTVSNSTYGNKSLNEKFNGLSIKEFRAEITHLSSLEDIKNVKIIINNSNFSNAEKQMLLTECTKQQGKIQNNPSVYIPENSSSSHVKDDDGRIYSKTSYELFRLSKTPAQREMANTILADKRLYAAGSERSIILKQILTKCTSINDVNIKKQLINKLLEDSRFLNKSGALNEYVMYCIQNVNSENINAQIQLLNLYKHAKTNLNGNVFAYMVYKLSDEPNFQEYIDSIKIILNSKKIDTDYINNNATKDFLDDIINLCKKSDKGYINNLSIEDIISNYNLRTIILANLSNNTYKQSIESLKNSLLNNKDLYNTSRYKISSEDFSIDYPSYIRDVLETLSAKASQDTNFDKIFQFASNILTDNNLGKNIGALKILAEFLSYDSYEPERLQYVYNALINGIKNNYNPVELYNIARKAYEADIKTYIADFVKKGKNYNSENDALKNAFYPIFQENEDIYKNFVRGRAYTDENLYDLHKYAGKEYGKDILSDLCTQQEFSAQGILSVMKHTSENTVELVKKVLIRNNISAQEKVNIITAIDLNQESLDIIKLVLEHDDLNLNTLPNILKSITVLDSYDINDSSKKTDPKKLSKYMQLLKNPKTSVWTVKMLNEGWDIDVISSLTPTKLKYYANKKEDDAARISNPNIKFFIDYGLNPKDANEIVKAISKNGTINVEMQKAAIDLLEKGIPKNKVAEVLNSATITGDYNSNIAADYIGIQKLGLDAFTERYLPIINNLSSAEIAIKYDSKTISDMKSMISNIPQDVKPALRAMGFNIEGILKKLNSKVVMSNKNAVNSKTARITNSQWRTKASLTSFEKILIDKYEPKEIIWRSEKNTRDWAESKYQAIKSRYYKSDAQTKNYDNTKINELRQKYLASWFEYLDSMPELKKNPSVKVIIADYITKNLRTDNTKLPPKFDTTLAKKILSDALKENSKIKNSKKQKQNNAVDITLSQINNRKVVWNSFNKTDSSYTRRYKQIINNMTNLTSGTALSKQIDNIDMYIQQGNVHFLVDDFGLTQLCMLENNNGEIEAILTRNENTDTISAYIDFIQDFISKQDLKCSQKLLETSNKAKPVFDKTKSELHALAEQNNYTAILQKMGIDTEKMPDGTISLSHYSPYINQFALSNFGIDEDKLLSNVSSIKGDVNLEDSNATSMPKLKSIIGDFNSGSKELQNLNELERIKNRKIHW